MFDLFEEIRYMLSTWITLFVLASFVISFFHLSELSYEVTDVLVLCVSFLSVIDLAVITVLNLY